MPTGITLTNPVLAEAKIEKFRLKLASEISWLSTTALGIAKKMKCPTKDGKSAFFAPLVEQEYKKDYFPCFPNNKFPAFSFFYLPNGENRVEQDSHHGSTHRSLDVDLIVYADMYALDSLLGRDITRDIQKSIEFVILRKHLIDSFEVKEVLYSVEDVYTDFDHRSIDDMFLSPQYTTLRFRMTLQYTDTIFSQVSFTP